MESFLSHYPCVYAVLNNIYELDGGVQVSQLAIALLSACVDLPSTCLSLTFSQLSTRRSRELLAMWSCFLSTQISPFGCYRRPPPEGWPLPAAL